MPRQWQRYVCLSIVCLLIGLTTGAIGQTKASSTTYDGIWFIGFNLRSNLWKGEKGFAARMALAHAIPRGKIADIARAVTIPDSFIPPGLGGYENQPWPEMNYRLAKEWLVKAGLSMEDPRIKAISLLHTSGRQTVEIAEQLAKAARHAGFQIIPEVVESGEPKKWEEVLHSGKYPLFLMGYKAERSTPESAWDAETILRPLFYSKGFANFFFVNDEQTDRALAELFLVPMENRERRNKLLQNLNTRLFELLPALPLFYIPTL